MDDSASRTPVPDPTRLTTEQLIREIAGLREILETRLNGMDKAIELLQATSDKFPERIDEKITSLREIHEEKFRSIQTQFVERDVRAEQTSRDSKTAVDAALQAAKEAVGKSETATLKQIDQLGTLIGTGTKATDDKIYDMKERLTRIEGTGLGVSTAKSDSAKTLTLIIAGAAVVVSVVLGSGFMNRQSANGPPAPPFVIYQSPSVPPAPGGGGTVTDSKSTTRTQP